MESIVIANYPNHIIIKAILVIVSVIITGAGLLYTFSRKYKDRKLNDPSNNKAPGSLDMQRYLLVFKIGLTMVGSFRYRDGANISYHCFGISLGDVIALPIIPLGCYDCEVFANISGDCPEWVFRGSQPWLLGEVISLYSRWFWFIGGFALISLLILLSQ